MLTWGEMWCMPHDALGTDHHETQEAHICQFVVRDAEQKYIEEHYNDNQS